MATTYAPNARWRQSVSRRREHSPLVWPQFTKTLAGDGGVVRRVSVKIGKSVLIRPVIKLCLISDF